MSDLTPRTEAGRTLFSRLWALNPSTRPDEVSMLIATVEQDIAAIEAEARNPEAIPDTPSLREALDVERLAQALFATHPLLYPVSWPNDDPDDIGPDPQEDARRIAAEYAALDPEAEAERNFTRSIKG